MNILPLVLAGGFGKRLSPLSTEELPKQFIHFFDNEESFFQKTIKRLRRVFITETIVVCCNEKHLDLVKIQLKKINETNFALIIEKESRNTFASVLLGLNLAKRYEINTMLVVPSDSFIENNEVFYKNIHSAITESYKTKKHVIFGIKPHEANNNYGYIKISDNKKICCVKNKKNNFFDVESFIEKPDIETAEKFVKYGDCFWNSGQFVFNIEKLKQEIKQYQKEAWRIFSKMKLIKKSKNLYITDNIFLTIPNLQIDRAIIEKSKNLLCCEAEFDWCDIGSFEVLKYLISVKKIQTVGNYFNV